MLVRCAVILTLAIIPIVHCHRLHSGEGTDDDECFPCKCYPWQSRTVPGLVEANCSSRSLESMPHLISHHIASLKASFNSIKKIPNDFFGHIKMKIMNLDFSNNSISIIGEKSFEQLPELWIANFTGNEIENLHHDTFVTNTKLWYLVLRGNNINIEGHTILLDAPKLGKIDLSYNNIRALKDTTFSKMPNIIYLRLHNNQLRTLKSSWFQPLEKLERLYLQYNLLTHLDTDTFINTPKLFELILSWNNLIIPSSSPFLRVPNLEYLHLTGCDLGSIPDHMFEFTPRLRMLWINSNRLHSFSTGLLNGLQTLKMFDACDNNFVCSCDLKELWQVCHYREIAAIVNCASENGTVPKSHSHHRTCEGSWDILADMVCTATNKSGSEAQAQDQTVQDTSSIVYLVAYVILGILILVIIVAVGGFVYWKCRSHNSSHGQGIQNLVYSDMMPLNDERHE